MAGKLRKVAVTLPPELVDSVDYIAGRLGVSRSAFIAQALSDGVRLLLPLLQQVPLDPTPADLVRFRGESAEVVRQRFESLKGMTDDLFAEK